jgi:hypothetical protein
MMERYSSVDASVGTFHFPFRIQIFWVVATGQAESENNGDQIKVVN